METETTIESPIGGEVDVEQAEGRAVRKPDREPDRETWASFDAYRRSPALHDAIYRKRSYVPEPTDSQVFGMLYHMLVTQTHLFDESYVCIPKEVPAEWTDSELPEKLDKRKASHKRFWADYSEKAAGKTPIEEGKWNQLMGMFHAAESHGMVEQWLSHPGALKAHPIEFEILGLEMRVRLELAVPHLGILADFKTSADVRKEPFAREGERLGHDVKAAICAHAYELEFGHTPECMLIAQSKGHRQGKEKTPCGPYDVEVYRLSNRTMQAGFDKAASDIEALLLSRELDCWETRSFGTVVDLEYPSARRSR